MHRIKFTRKIVIYLIALLFISLLFLIGGKNVNQTVSIFQVEPKDVKSIKVSCNEKETIILDQSEISTFMNLIKRCSTPIKMRKMRVVKRYVVELELKETQVEIKFLRKYDMPFMMIPASYGKIKGYECQSMESFLKKYK